MKRLGVLMLIALSGCRELPNKAVKEESINLTGTVEKVCTECEEFLLVGVGSGGLLLDVLTVHIDSPEAYSGIDVSVRILLVDDFKSNRLRYPESSHITFPVYKSAIAGRQFMVPASNISAAN